MLSGFVYNIQRLSVQDGPGIRTTVFLKGCPLSCLWCSNPESQKFNSQLLYFENLCVGCGSCVDQCPQSFIYMQNEKSQHAFNLCKDCGACTLVCRSKARFMSGQEMSVDEVMTVVRKDSLFYANSDGGVTFGGGEATSQKKFLLGLMKASQEEGYHITLDTCGYCYPSDFEEFLPYTDLFLFDCKHMDSEIHKKITGKDNSMILENLTLVLNSNKKVKIRIPLIPSINDTEDNISRLANFLGKYYKDLSSCKIEIMPYHEYGKSKYTALGLENVHYTSYTAEALDRILELFQCYNLKPTII